MKTYLKDNLRWHAPSTHALEAALHLRTEHYTNDGTALLVNDRTTARSRSRWRVEEQVREGIICPRLYAKCISERCERHSRVTHTLASLPAKSLYPITVPLTHLLHVPPSQGCQPSASLPCTGSLSVTKWARIAAPGCAGYGETGRVDTGGASAGVDRRSKSDRWRADRTEATGLNVGNGGVPDTMKDPEGPRVPALDGGDEDGRRTGLYRICRPR